MDKVKIRGVKKRPAAKAKLPARVLSLSPSDAWILSRIVRTKALYKEYPAIKKFVSDTTSKELKLREPFRLLGDLKSPFAIRVGHYLLGKSKSTAPSILNTAKALERWAGV